MALVYRSAVQGGPHFSGGGPNLARVAQINITGPYGGSPGGPHSIIYPTLGSKQNALLSTISFRSYRLPGTIDRGKKTFGCEPFITNVLNGAFISFHFMCLFNPLDLDRMGFPFPSLDGSGNLMAIGASLGPFLVET